MGMKLCRKGCLRVEGVRQHSMTCCGSSSSINEEDSIALKNQIDQEAFFSTLYLKLVSMEKEKQNDIP